LANRRQPLLFPILVGSFAIAFAITVLVGWSIIFTKYYIVATDNQVADLGAGYWVLLAGGCVFLALVIAALILFLVANIRQSLYVRRQDTFVDSVTHELKSPLASLRVALDTMNMRELTPAQQDRFLSMMDRDVDRLQAFIDHVLEAGRLEHGRRQFVSEPVSVPAIVDQVLDVLRKRHDLPAGAIELDMKLSQRSESMLTDPMALDIILLNLVDNAVKYSHGSPVILVSLWEEEPSQLVIEVTDHGAGIPEGQLKKVFRRFHRVQVDGQRKVPGTGLGLYVVRFLVQHLGGKIDARSEGLGEGATFRVRLPIKMGSEDQ
jgi:signal transduction histidine kinase